MTNLISSGLRRYLSNLCCQNCWLSPDCGSVNIDWHHDWLNPDCGSVNIDWHHDWLSPDCGGMKSGMTWMVRWVQINSEPLDNKDSYL